MPFNPDDFASIGLQITEQDFARLSKSDRIALISQAENFALQMQQNMSPFFVPNGAQEEFIRGVGTQHYGVGKNIFLSTAGNGVGKSSTVALLLSNLFFGVQSKWFKYPTFQRNWNYPKLVWFMSEHSTLTNVVEKEVDKWFPKGRYEFSKAGKTFKSHLVTDTGWVMDCLSYDQEVKQFESATVGLCIEENERVLMADGRWISIKDVNIGDKVVSYGAKNEWGRDRWRSREYKKPKSNSQQINNVSNKVVYTNRDILKITCVGGMVLKCTPDHVLYSPKNGWIKAEELKIRDYLFSPEYKTNVTATIEKWQAGMLGVLVGDGMMRGKCIHLTCFNDNLLDCVKKILPSNFYLRAKPRRQYFISSKTSGRNELKEWLVSIGIWGKLAHQKFIPDIIFQQPEELRIEFLKYLYATDGWASGCSIGYASTSKRLCEDLVLLLKSLGIKSTFHFRKSQKPGKWRDQWYVMIGKRVSIKRFCDKITIPSKETQQQKVLEVALARRYGRKEAVSFDKKMVTMCYRRCMIKSIERMYGCNVVDIQTDPNHNFIVNGFLVHNCLFDEPPPQDIFKAGVTRTRGGGIVIMSMTPLSHSAWIKDELIDNPDKSKYVWLHHADVEANCIEHGTRGRIPHERIMFMLSQYDEDEMEARARGRFLHLAGNVYKMLHPSKHRPERLHPENFNQEDYEIICAMDIHDRRPPFIGWGALGKDRRLWLVDEFPNDPDKPYHQIKSTDLTYRDIARIIKEKEILNGWNKPHKIRRVIDPNFGRQTRMSVGKTVQEIIALEGRQIKYPLYFNPYVNDSLVEGHSEVKSFLAMRPDGKPGLIFSEHCFNTWHAINRYGFKEHNVKTSDTEGLSERVAQKYKDGADMIRYMVMSINMPLHKEEPPPEPKVSRPVGADIVVVSEYDNSWQNPWSNMGARRR